MRCAADDSIVVERAALQLAGMQSPQSHMHTVLRGLGLSPAEAASLFPAVEQRTADIVAGRFARPDLATSPAVDPEPTPPACWEDHQVALMRLVLAPEACR